MTAARPVGCSVRAELLSFAELETRIADAPLVFIPLGSLEFHGVHLPIGLDALTAHGVCVRVAHRTGGVVLPALYWGTGGGHSNYPWTLMMPTSDVIAAGVQDTLHRLEMLGVRRAVLFSGHFATEQLEWMTDLEERWNGDGTRPLTVIATSIDRCPTSPMPPDHAGAFESSVLHAIEPGLVNLDRLSTERVDDADEDAWSSRRHDPEHPLWGVFGADPRGMSLSGSGQLLEHLVGWLESLTRAAIESSR